MKRILQQIGHTIACMVLVLLLFGAGSGWSQVKLYNAAGMIMTYSNSPRVNALGGSAVALTDEQSAHFNPGAVGLYFFDHDFSMSIPWNNASGPLDTYTTFSIGVNVPPRFLFDSERQPLSVPIGLVYSYAKTEQTLLYTDYSDPYGQDQDDGQYFCDNVRTHALTAGIGFTVGKVQFGVGYTITFFKQHLFDDFEFTGTAHDIGMAMRCQLLNRSRGDGKSRYTLDATLALVHDNIGDIDCISKTFDFPEASHLGASLEFSYIRNDLSILSVLPTMQYDDPSGSWDNTLHLGVEVGGFDMVFLRCGYCDQNKYSYDDNSFTYGAGFSTRGLTALLFDDSDSITKHGKMQGILKNLDISFDYARSSYPYMNPANFMKLHLSF